jgi:uncharacterized membrane protein (UPF0127 family)
MLRVDIADTPSKLERGLMFVTAMPDDEGMLFLFNRPQKLAFWGKNTFIPLDIAFIDRDNKIANIERIKPFSLERVGSNRDCTMALEVNAGYFEHNGISEGDELVLDHGDDLRAKASVEFRVKEGSGGTVKESQLIQQQKVPQVPTHPSHQPPVGQPPTTPMQDEKNLPTLDAGDLAKILEDSYDEEEQPAELPEEQPLPGEKPEGEEPEVEIPHFDNIFDALKWAEMNRQVMRIAYTTRSGRKITRDIEPHGQFHADSTMHQILVCFDETVSDIRAFIMTNIGTWSFLGRTFQKKFIVRA